MLGRDWIEQSFHQLTTNLRNDASISLPTVMKPKRR
jgi:hypothetical protein